MAYGSLLVTERWKPNVRKWHIVDSVGLHTIQAFKPLFLEIVLF